MDKATRNLPTVYGVWDMQDLIQLLQKEQIAVVSCWEDNLSGFKVIGVHMEEK